MYLFNLKLYQYRPIAPNVPRIVDTVAEEIAMIIEFKNEFQRLPLSNIRLLYHFSDTPVKFMVFDSLNEETIRTKRGR
jgi:hypothetical protein